MADSSQLAVDHDQPQGERIRFSLRTLLVVVMVAGVLFGLVGIWIRSAHQVARESTCASNLRQIGLGFHNYHDFYHRLPFGATPGPDGTAVHSWRMSMMPFFESHGIHFLYNFNEPWNGPENRNLASVFDVATLYACPCRPNAQAKSDANFLVISGLGTAFPADATRSFADIRDGTSHTIIAAESLNTRIHWMEPRDLRIDEMSFVINDNSKPSISSRHSSGPAVLFADAKVYRISESIDPDTLKALLTISGGELVDRDHLIDDGLLNR